MSELAEYPQEPGAWDMRTHGSGLVEQVLEYRFLAAVTAGLLSRGQRFEVLRGDFDLDGHDVAIEAGGIFRHIQLKCMVDTGASRRVQINTRLAAKPSGSIVWMSYDAASLEITRWRWFGGEPGQSLGDLGERVAKHSRANSHGLKSERPHIRVLPCASFVELPDVAALIDRLFGPIQPAPLSVPTPAASLALSV